MKIRTVMDVLQADLLYGEDLGRQVDTAFAGDLMSDVLAYAGQCGVLLTGLVNAQVVRTADMLDICCIVFVRGKTPGEDVLALAKSKNMVILRTKHLMFTSCGILHENGLKGGRNV